ISTRRSLAKIDLQLLTGRRLEPHGCPCLRGKLPPIPLHRPFDRAQADDNALLGGQLLADHVGIAAMPAQALSQPLLVTIERLFSLHFSVRRPTRRPRCSPSPCYG